MRRRHCRARPGALWAIALALALSAGCREAPLVRPVESPRAAPISPPPSAASGGAPVPYESEGACPFECCVYRTWTVQRATDVRAAREKGSPVAFTVQTGEKVEALTGVVVVSRPGRARAPRDVAIEGLGTLRAGDEVAVLHPLGEGYWLVRHNGQKGSGQVGKEPARPGRLGTRSSTRSRIPSSSGGSRSAARTAWAGRTSPRTSATRIAAGEREVPMTTRARPWRR